MAEPSGSLSSHYSNRRNVAHEPPDRSVYAVGQTLVTVVNDPRLADHKNSWLWGLTQDQSWNDAPPPLDPNKYPNIQRQHLESFLKVMEGKYDEFVHNRQRMEQTSEETVAAMGTKPVQGQGLVLAMQKVPADFFQEDFSLNRQDIMAELCHTQDDDEIHDKIEELTGYLDTVESQLLQEIAARTVLFFEAAGSLQELRAVLGDALDEVRRLRGQVASTDDSAYRAALTVTRLQRRRTHMQAVVDHLKDVAEVEGSWGLLQAMLEGGDYAGGLELLHNIRHSLQQLAAAGVGCLATLRPRVEESISGVETLLVGELLQVAQFTGLPAAVETTMQAAVAKLEGREADAAHVDAVERPLEEGGLDPAREQLHDQLLPLVVGLHRAERLLGVMSQFRENAALEAKAAVRGVLEGLVLLLHSGQQEPLAADGHHGRDVQLAERLAGLEHGQLLILLEALRQAVAACAGHCRVVGALMEDILVGVKAPRGQVQAVRREVEGAVVGVLEVGLARWVKVLGARTQVHTRLRLSELQQLLRCSEEFVASAEGQGVRASSAFRGALQAQCKAYLEQMHIRCIHNLQQLLEVEQWVQVQVPPDFQAIVDRLAAGGALAGPSKEGRTEAQAAGGGQGGAAQVMVGGRGYHVVNSGLMLLKLVEELMGLCGVVSVFGAEVAQKVVDLLKLYNSQSCQLVLGAGATRTAGLKSISAKHLALSCQMLSLLAALQPLLRNALVANVPTPRKALLIPEFDRMLQDVNLHRDEIHTKLVDIMQDRLLSAVRTLAAEAEAWANPVGATDPSPTVRTLTKQLLTLNTVLKPILLPEEVQQIFSRVASLYSDTLADTLQQLPTRGPHWESKCQANVLLILDTFRQLPLPTTRASSLLSRLNTYYTKHFGPPPDRTLHPSPRSQATTGTSTNATPEHSPRPLNYDSPRRVANPTPPITPTLTPTTSLDHPAAPAPSNPTPTPTTTTITTTTTSETRSLAGPADTSQPPTSTPNTDAPSDPSSTTTPAATPPTASPPETPRNSDPNAAASSSTEAAPAATPAASEAVHSNGDAAAAEAGSGAASARSSNGDVATPANDTSGDAANGGPAGTCDADGGAAEAGAECGAGGTTGSGAAAAEAEAGSSGSGAAAAGDDGAAAGEGGVVASSSAGADAGESNGSAPEGAGGDETEGGQQGEGDGAGEAKVAVDPLLGKAVVSSGDGEAAGGGEAAAGNGRVQDGSD